jgi:hypothetical protein
VTLEPRAAGTRKAKDNSSTRANAAVAYTTATVLNLFDPEDFLGVGAQVWGRFGIVPDILIKGMFPLHLLKHGQLPIAFKLCNNDFALG